MHSARPNASSSLQRDWHDLKPGDVIWFNSAWREVFDAYPSGHDTVTIKLIVRAAKCPTRIETHRVCVNNTTATCQA
ncbi:hypothetical protein [Mucisphaera calidilacus]|uniref:Uncharacterized protein n=1 Tax=Mucisphaera calidilacus TaxID=2527982 RepID=A0A518BVR4_9BACT|nr:hypothetical protein [Mucisphaera calidilacus]QDU71051.1 hypothetical protein Pan265_08960 [Mucisphaera calidilacus]